MSESAAPPRETREVTVSEAVSLAVQLHRQGDLDEAETIYRAVLERVPNHADALNFLGVLADQRGRSAEAERLISRAVALVPDFADFSNNLGNVLKGMGRLQEAEEAYRKVLRLQPDHPGALSNLGVILRALGRLDESAELLSAAVERWPEHWAAHLNLGNTLRRLGRLREAVDSHLRAIALEPSLTPSLKLRIYALYASGRQAQAVELVDQWLAEEPGSAMALHLRAAVSGEAVPDRASDRFVTQTFDTFSEHFDELLCELQYRAPELLGDAVAEVLPPPAADLRVVDAGCGTGLCGPLLRPYARRLIGVDLSSGMLQKAAQRGVYDQLVTRELTEFLTEQPAAFDLIVSADTLCYFGALETVLAAATRALGPGGFLAFTVEKAGPDAPTAGFLLEHHGRYCHAEPYVRQCLDAAGLAVETIRDAVLRNEAGNPVPGLVVLARRPK